jgi:hypothetical protein
MGGCQHRALDAEKYDPVDTAVTVDLTCDVAQLDFVEELIDIRLRPVSHQQRKSDGYCDSNLTFRLGKFKTRNFAMDAHAQRIPPRSSRSFTWRRRRTKKD